MAAKTKGKLGEDIRKKKILSIFQDIFKNLQVLRLAIINSFPNNKVWTIPN